LKDGMESAKVIDWIDRGIVVAQTESTSDLYTVPVEPDERRSTGNPRQIPYPRTGRNVSPVWSPDGTRLAFVSSNAAQPNRRYVVVMSDDGAATREFLIPTSSFEYEGARAPYDLRWFGDGRGLGFSGTDARFSQAVFRLRLDTGEWDTIPLSLRASWTRTEWNADGSAFYFARHPWAEENAGIFEKGVNGDAERPVYRAEPGGGSIRSLQLSPDRRRLAFEENRTPGNDTLIMRIVVVDVATGDTRTVLENTTDSTDLNRTIHLVGWSPSGDLWIWRPAAGTGSPETVLVPVNGGVPRPVAIQTFDPTAPRDPHRPLIANWSPTGRSIVVVQESRSYRTFVIENPLPAVRATGSSRR
jgi:Tol biopolymer transport system component